MAKDVKAIPDGYHTITPYLIINGAAKALDFYQKAFGVEQIMRCDHENGKIKHAQFMLGNSPVMLADEFPEFSDAKSPIARGGTTVYLYVYVENVDAFVDRAVAAGAKLIAPVQDQFYGDRSGGVQDPFGHVWWIATHIKDVSEEEINQHKASCEV